MSALLFAFITPFVWALMTVCDKYIVSKHVRHPLAYMVPVGLAHLLLGGGLALFLSWHGISGFGILVALIAGVLLGMQMYSYFQLLKVDDASEVIGFQYIYPVVVALMSFIVLNERLSIIGYIGVTATVLGAVLLCVRTPDFRGVRLMVYFIVLVASTEFVLKIAAISLPEWHGLALNSIAVACAVLPAGLLASVRPHVKAELSNFKFALPTEALTFAAVGCAYFAMQGVSATVVSAIGAAEPLAVMSYEGIGAFFGIRMVRHNWRRKLIPLALIVLGVALIYLEL